MIPVGWSATTIGDCLIDATTRNTDKNFSHDDLRSVNKTLGMIPMKDRVKGKSVERAKIVKSGWFAYNPMRINVGSICRWNASDDCIVSPDYVVFKCNEEYLLGDYFEHFRQSHRWTKFMDDAGSGSVRIRIYLDDLKQLSCLLPPIAEQRQIAKILSTWDQAIEATDELIAKSEAHKKALMQQLLTGEKRLPGFQEKWKLTALKDVGKTSSGGTPDSNNSEYWQGDIAWATPTDITTLSSRYISKTERYISASGLANSSAKLLPANSLIICTRATVGKAAITNIPISTNQGFKNIVPNAKYDVNFLYYLLAHFQKRLIRSACGSTFLELSKNDFDKLRFEMPNKEEQSAISSVLSNIDAEIEALESSYQHLKAEKTALMQQLLTGKRRVKVKEEKAA